MTWFAPRRSPEILDRRFYHRQPRAKQGHESRCVSWLPAIWSTHSSVLSFAKSSVNGQSTGLDDQGPRRQRYKATCKRLVLEKISSQGETGHLSPQRNTALRVWG